MVQYSPMPSAASNPIEEQGRFLSVADDIGCRLVRDAIWSGGRCSWLVWTKQGSNGVMRSIHTAASMDIYLGIAGIALFFAHLTRLTGDTHQQKALHGAINQLEHQLTQAASTVFGFYGGSSGAAWTLAVIGDMLAEKRWVSTGLNTLRHLAETSDTRGQFDLLSGQAGLVLALVTAGEHFDKPELVQAASSVGDSLVAGAVRGPNTASWPSNAGETRNLLGLSHGTTGILLALLELNRLCPKAEYRAVARDALHYERAAYSPEHKNWPDYRTLPGLPVQQPAFPVAWCHGSTGMGIARLRLLDFLPDDPDLMPEIDVALSNATAMLNAPISPVATDMTLCHGLTGNAELLLMVGDRFDRPDALAAASKVGDVIIDLSHRPRMPWVCGIPDCGESPSLLTGSAGIGLYFLRLYNRTAVPGILLPAIVPPSKQKP